MSKANKVRELGLSLVGERYSLGNESWYNIGWEPSKDPRATDCSGLIYAVLRKAGVLVAGKTLPRETAHDYYKRAKRISKPSKVGDLAFFLKNGHATHVALYIGKGETVEAGYHGPNNTYPGSGYVGTCTVAQMNRRGARWGRLNTDIGELEEDDMTKEESRLLKEIKLSTVAASYDAAIHTALLKEAVRALGGDPDAAESMESRKKTEVGQAKRSLGL
jgi:cell wall-associated NlpC family hydrolase